MPEKAWTIRVEDSQKIWHSYETVLIPVFTRTSFPLTTHFIRRYTIIQPFSTPLISKILFRHTSRTVREKLISCYVWTLITCWGHFSASLVAQHLKKHKSNVSRPMKKNLFLSTLWESMLKKVLEKPGKKAWLILDSTIKGKRGKKLCNLQKFRTAHGSIPWVIVSSLPCLSAKTIHSIL